MSRTRRISMSTRGVQALLVGGALGVSVMAVAPANALGAGTVTGTTVCGSPDKVVLVGSHLSDPNASDYQVFTQQSPASASAVHGQTLANVVLSNGSFRTTVTLDGRAAAGHTYTWGLTSLSKMAEDAGSYTLRAATCTTLTASPKTVLRGQIETVTLHGYKARERIVVRISGRRLALGSVVAGSRGNAVFKFRVATSTTLGKHTITGRGVTSHRTASTTVTVRR